MNGIDIHPSVRLRRMAIDNAVGLSEEGARDRLQTLEDAPPMDPDIKQRWTAALRSGHFPQTIGRLHRARTDGSIPVGYCCLGVLATLDHKVTSSIDPYGYNVRFNFAGHGGSVSNIPTEYAEERYGLSDAALDALMDLNDEKVPFDLMADLIEAYL